MAERRQKKKKEAPFTMRRDIVPSYRQENLHRMPKDFVVHAILMCIQGLEKQVSGQGTECSIRTWIVVDAIHKRRLARGRSIATVLLLFGLLLLLVTGGLLLSHLCQDEMHGNNLERSIHYCTRSCTTSTHWRPRIVSSSDHRAADSSKMIATITNLVKRTTRQ
jgi:hypothetical protein